jgi:hypothetical protein
MKIYFTAILVIVINLIFIGKGYSQWTSNVSQNNSVVTAPGNQLEVRSIPDKDGGVILIWQDQRTGTSNRHIYAQRLDKFGYKQWGDSNGLPISTDNFTSRFYDICPDGKGGAIIMWSLFSSTFVQERLKAQRVSFNGTKLWTDTGYAITNEGNKQEQHVIRSDNNGGCYFAYQTSELASTDFELKANRLDSNGNRMWGTGVFICQAPGIQRDLEAVVSTDGGFIVSWVDPRNSISTYSDIFMQKVNSSGAIQWAANGVTVVNSNWDQQYQKMYPDNNGGSYIVWDDYRTSDSITTRIDVYAQRIRSNGQPAYMVNGVPVCTFAEQQYRPEVTTDMKGGIITCWYDTRNGPNSPFNFDIYAQRVDSSGNMKWTLNGVQVCDAPLSQIDQKIITDSSYGAIMSWDDRRAGTSVYDIYAQRVDSSGNLLWNPDDVAVSLAPGNQFKPAMTTTNNGIIFIFEDTRNGSSNYDLFAQKVLRNGSTILGINENGAVPSGFNLYQNFPNPFNPLTVIGFDISLTSKVKLTVYDVLGREIKVLLDEVLTAGSYKYNFNASTLISGIYFYTLKAGNSTLTRSMVLVK